MKLAQSISNDEWNVGLGQTNEQGKIVLSIDVAFIMNLSDVLFIPKY